MGSTSAGPWGGPAGTSPVGLTFDRPEWLLLIPTLCLLAWLLARGTLAGGGLTRRTAHLALRCGVLGLLVAALAHPLARWRADTVTVVAVLDASASVPADQRVLAERFLAGSLPGRPLEDRFGLITVGRDAMVQMLPTNAVPRADIGATGPADASNLQQGVDLARTLLPPDSAGRLLLISDGNQTSGSLSTAAASLLTAGVPVDVALIEYDRSSMVRLEELAVPPWARVEDTISAKIVLSAGAPAAGRLTVSLNGSPVDLDPNSPASSARVSLEAGKQVLAVPLTLPPGSVHRVEAVFEPDDDSNVIPQLLRAESVVFTNDRGRILVLTENPDASAPFVKAISSDNLRVESLSASSGPATIEAWAAFDAVVLFNQPVFNFSRAQQESLARYVADAGGGLLMLGGPDSFGAGGWAQSPVADVLPLLLEPPQKRELPMGALAIILDRSGSMSALVGPSDNQQQLANEAAILGVRALKRLDQVAVVAFDDGVDVVVPLTPATDRESIANRIRAVGPRGGTNLFPAIDAAATQLAGSPAGSRHIVILTDGQTIGDPQDGLARARALRQKNITISTVSIGDQANDPLLESLAKVGGGRFYSVKVANAKAVLPQIFITETQVVSRTLIWEGEPFSPLVSAASDSMRGLASGLPPLTGYIVTADRGGLSTVALRGRENDPILAQWQHGLGRVTAYTSDAATRWNTAWTSWEGFGTFWTQQLKWVMRPSDDSKARVTVENRGDLSRVRLELLDAAGDRVNFASVVARVAPPQGAEPAADAAREFRLRQTGPGAYEGELPTREVGTHIVSLGYQRADGEQGRGGTARAALVRRAGEEFRRSTPDAELMMEIARRTGGKLHKLTPAGADLWSREHLTMPSYSRPIWLHFAIAAIVLLLIDVAARRLTLDPQRAFMWTLGLFAPTLKPASASMVSLSAAKARAAEDLSRRASPSQPREPELSSRPPAAFDAFSSQPARPLSPVPPPATPPATRPSPAKSPPASAAGLQEQSTMERLRSAKNRSKRE